MSVFGWVILAVANIPLYVVVGSCFFKDWDDFGSALVFWIKPDLLSALHGEFWDDWWAETKLGFMVICSVVLVWGEGVYLVIPHVLPLFK